MTDTSDRDLIHTSRHRIVRRIDWWQVEYPTTNSSPVIAEKPKTGYDVINSGSQSVSSLNCVQTEEHWGRSLGRKMKSILKRLHEIFSHIMCMKYQLNTSMLIKQRVHKRVINDHRCCLNVKIIPQNKNNSHDLSFGDTFTKFLGNTPGPPGYMLWKFQSDLNKFAIFGIAIISIGKFMTS